MDNSIIVCQATIRDLDLVAELFNEYRVFYGQASDLQGARDFLFERFEHQESVILYAKEAASGRSAGFTQLYPLFSSISMQRLLLLNDLYVAPQYRRNGVGQLLMDEAKQYAKLVRAKGIQLSTGVENQTAQSLYERNGYVRDSVYYHYFLAI
ncbi:acetyltransferase [Paenibacillus jamilae]|uniref:GNAT family N-acetyltransferase n=1 Tax=Paenibacillus jamilae TaxID=114136 RepID=UPI0007ABE58B|nr:GNAT family N-acetyltransferase [Paenibacillus jamilae]KZE65111.1 acetyltransferase [Paenibacillus jamilae]